MQNVTFTWTEYKDRYVHEDITLVKIWHAKVMNHERKDGLTAFIDERKSKTALNKFIYFRTL